MKKDIRAYTYEQLAAEMEQIGEKKFRAKQIYEWLHVKLADSFEEMTNLSKALREKLEAEYEILPVKMLERQISKIDATNKFLFQLSDGCGGKCADALQARKFRLHFFSGGLPDGMQILCFYHRWAGEKSVAV